MLRRFRFLPLILLVLSLPLCADFFKTTARRTAAAAAQSTPAAPTSQPSPQAARTGVAVQPTPRRDPLVIRIGVVNYNGSEKTHFDYEQILARMAGRQKDQKISFRLVDGAYDDVLEWYKSGLLNVAILSPGVVAELMTLPEWKDELKNLYIATEGSRQLQPVIKFATRARYEPGAQYNYNPVCLVRDDSPIKSVEDIRRLTASTTEMHKIKFIFVHPLSVSGYILPEYVLREKYGIDTSKEQIEWSYDHVQSLRQLSEDDPDGDARVAFVKDDTEAPAKFRKIDLTGLEEERGIIPQDVVLIHPNFIEHKEQVKKLFGDYGEEFKRGAQPKAGEENLWKVYEPRDDWQQQYAHVVGWLGALHLTADEGAQQFLTLEQIVGKLRNLKRNRPDTRLALVLSGGGAKCAYQLGAIRAIEDELDTYTDKNGKRDVDIDLVVGTSGGAINALCVALGVTRDPHGMSALERTWEGFSQTTFFEPWGPFPATIGLFLGLLQAILIILCVRLFAPEKINWHRHAGKIAAAMLVVAVVLALTRLRAWAIIPLIVLFLIICVRLFSTPTRIWWKHAGWAMLALALLEVPVAFLDWTPWRHTEYVVTITLAALEFIVIVIVVRIYNTFSRRWLQHSLVIFAVAVVAELVLLRRTGYWSAFSRLGKDHVVHHLWLLVTLGPGWTVLSLLLVGGALLLIGHTKFSGWQPMDYNIIPSGKNERSLLVFRRHLLLRLSLALAAIVALQLSLSLFHYDSLSDSAGIQKAMADQVPALVKTLHHNLSVSGATDEAKLDDLSRQIIAGDGEGKDWLTRDLVITSMKLPAGEGGAGVGVGSESCAPADKSDAASDWYFYFDHRDAHQSADEAAVAASDPHAVSAARAESSDEFIKKDTRFRSLRCGEYGDKLMDVVIGSSSIFPVFQPRALTASVTAGDVGRPATLAELIDGGFAHNSPIEAAVLWGATHIILVEAS
ncbi:MAG: hypothetical protein QOF61_771, partial [Acidobacteriota bacterium]|nr:hypothetical protein [Acidobacteriota bacterium]